MNKKSCENKKIFCQSRRWLNPKRPPGLSLSQVVAAGLFFLLVFPSASVFASTSRTCNASKHAETRRWTDDQAIQCILGESRGEPFFGQVAVGEVLRRNPKVPFYGAATIKKAYGKYYALEHDLWIQIPDRIVAIATQAWSVSKTSNYSKGADHFEGDSFKRPYWTKGMILTAHIGSQQFFKEAKP